MDRHEVNIIKKYCRGNRKTLHSIFPLGIDFEMPKAKFLFVFQHFFAQEGYVFSEEKSDDKTKVYINSRQPSAFFVTINPKGDVSEVNEVNVCNSYNHQLNYLEEAMSNYVELYGAPYEWVKLDIDLTACSWRALNGNHFSLCFNRANNEIYCRYLRSEFE